MSVLTVDLTRRLPDIDRAEDVPQDLERFGRFAILRGGGFWFGEVNSSHPQSTENGFYWGLARGTLFISPRGSTYRWTTHITDERIRELSRRLRLKGRYKQFRVVGREA